MTVLPVATSTGTPELDELLADLSRTLWKQRSLIELLQYRLEVQQLILASSREHRLQTALEEVEVAMEDIRRSERSRDVVVRQCAQHLQLPETASLGDIRVRVPDAWSAMLTEHQEALLSLVAETERLASMNRELAQRGANDSRALIDAVTGSAPASAYGPASGYGATAGRTLARPALVDRQA